MIRYSSEAIHAFVASLKPAAEGAADTVLPKITVVMPSYNQCRFLERAILSVLNQNYPNLEYIIVDGGSSDGSPDIIKKYENHLAWWVSEKDNGQSDALNKGFERGTGDVFFYLASDDILLPGVLHRIAGIFKSGDVDLVYGNRLIIDPQDRIISERRCVRYLDGLTRSGVFSGAGFAFYLDSAFYSREAFRREGGFDLSLNNTMDVDLSFRFLKHRVRARFVREYLIGFRVAESTKTVSAGHTRGEQEKAMLFARYASPFARLAKFPLFVLYMLLFLVQGDMDYVLFRTFTEKRKKYNEYF